MIALVGLSTDRTMAHALLAGRLLGYDLQFFDLLRFYQEGDFYWDDSTQSGFLEYGDVRLEFPDSKLTGIYARLIGLENDVPHAMRDRYRAFSTAMREVLARSSTLVINRPVGETSNSVKPFHMQILAACGFRVPETVVTNCSEHALAFVDSYSQVICKGISSEKTRALLVDQNERSKIAHTQSVPALFQERIGESEVRLHLVGDDIHAERITTRAVDYRFDKAPKQFDRETPPDEIVQACYRYRDLSGYEFIGFDFRVGHDGRYFALEANPMPGYDGYDRRSGLAISDSLFRLLSGKSVQRAKRSASSA